MKLAALLLLVTALLPAAASGSAARAHILLTSQAPVAVRGTGFRPRERVVVTVVTTTTRTKRVTVSRRGVFSVRFPGISIERCEAYEVRARGSRGSSAGFKVLPECAPS